MKTMILNLPTFAFVISTRAALAGGVALLASEKLPAERRRMLGAALVAVGAATTIPAVMWVARGLRRGKRARMAAGADRDVELIGITRFARKGDDDEA